MPPPPPTTSFIIGKNGGEDTSRIDRGSISTRDRCENRDEIGSCFFFRGERERERVIGSWWHTLMARWKKTAFLLIRLKIRDDSDRGWLERVAWFDLDPRVRRMSGRMAVVWRVIKVDGERETRILEILKIANIFTPRYKLEIKRKFFTIFFFLSLECTPRSRFKRMIYRVERCRFDEQEKKSCKKLQCSPPVSTRIVKDDGDKRFLIRDRTYKYGRTSEEQIFQGVIMLL